MRITGMMLVVITLTVVVGCAQMKEEKAKKEEAKKEFEKGNQFYDKGEYDKAIACYTEAIRLNPKFDDAYSNRGHAYGAKGEHDKEMADLKEALRLSAGRLPSGGPHGVQSEK